MNPDVAEDNLGEGDDDLVGLRDLDERGVHAGYRAADCCGVFVVREYDGAVGAFAVGMFVHFLHYGVFAFTGVDCDVRAVFFRELEAFVPGVDADDFVA